MRYPLCFLLLLLFVLGCQTDSKLTMETHSLNTPKCGDCAHFKIKLPYALDELKIAKTINKAIAEEVIYTLQFSDADAVSTAEEAASSFNTSYQKMVKEYGTFEEPWSANINGMVTFEDKRMVTIALESTLYTGGAHGYFSKVFLNFDKKKAKELEVYELFNDMQGFIALAEEKFRGHYQIPKEGNINTTGFMFPNDSFELPKAFGLTAEGLQLHYNPYDVSSYADGPLVLTIPYAAVNPFLKEAYRILD